MSSYPADPLPGNPLPGDLVPSVFFVLFWDETNVTAVSKFFLFLCSIFSDFVVLFFLNILIHLMLFWFTLCWCVFHLSFALFTFPYSVFHFRCFVLYFLICSLFGDPFFDLFVSCLHYVSLFWQVYQPLHLSIWFYFFYPFLLFYILFHHSFLWSFFYG